MLERSKLFKQLHESIDLLRNHPEDDSEACRHEWIVRPLLTSEAGLGWNITELLPQKFLRIPNSLKGGQAIRDGWDRNGARPDIIIKPIGWPSFAAIEEKGRHDNVQLLSTNRKQIREYEALIGCVWGVLTDGERWIIEKNFKIYMSFDSLAELERNFAELNDCLGRGSVLRRREHSGSYDIIAMVLVSPSTSSGLEKDPEYDDEYVVRYISRHFLANYIDSPSRFYLSSAAFAPPTRRNSKSRPAISGVRLSPSVYSAINEPIVGAVKFLQNDLKALGMQIIAEPTQMEPYHLRIEFPGDAGAIGRKALRRRLQSIAKWEIEPNASLI